MSVAGLAGSSADPESYFKHMSAVQTLKSMGDKVKGGKWGRMARAASKANMTLEALTARWGVVGGGGGMGGGGFVPVA